MLPEVDQHRTVSGMPPCPIIFSQIVRKYGLGRADSDKSRSLRLECHNPDAPCFVYAPDSN